MLAPRYPRCTPAARLMWHSGLRTPLPGTRLNHTATPHSEGVRPPVAGRFEGIINDPRVAQALEMSRKVRSNFSASVAEVKNQAHTHRRALWITAGVGTLVGTAYLLSGDDGASDPLLGRPNPADVAVLGGLPASKLMSGWIVYAFCSSPTLLNWSSIAFDVLRYVPGVSSAVNDIGRRTFFRQFCGEETAAAAENELWIPLREAHTGVISSYASGSKTSHLYNPPHEISAYCNGTLESIRMLGAYDGSTVRARLSALLPDPHTLCHASEYIVSRRKGAVHYPGIPEDGDFARLMTPEEGTDFERLLKGDRLSRADRTSVQAAYERLREFMAAAQTAGVRVIIDAEPSPSQPVVDVIAEQLMREFNTTAHPLPVVVASFEGYLRRNAELVESQLQRAKKGGYTLLFAQTTGQDAELERSYWIAQGKKQPNPVWDAERELEEYNTAITSALNAIKNREIDGKSADVGVVFATHSEASVDTALKALEDMGLATRTDDGVLRLSEFASSRVKFAQNYGMKDGLTNRTAGSIKSASGAPVVSKATTHGPMEEALRELKIKVKQVERYGPEAAIVERKRIGREMCRRYVPFYRAER